MKLKVILSSFLLILVLIIVHHFFLTKPLLENLRGIIKNEFKELTSFSVSFNENSIVALGRSVPFSTVWSGSVNRTFPTIECFNMTQDVIETLASVSEVLPFLIVEVYPNVSSEELQFPWIEMISEYEFDENGNALNIQRLSLWNTTQPPLYHLFYYHFYYNNTTSMEYTVKINETLLRNIFDKIKLLSEKCKRNAIYCNLTYFYICSDLPLF
jgi:hypothetical protein